MTSNDSQRDADSGGYREPPSTGMYISGSTFNGPIAQGHQARAVQFNQGTGAADTLARLERALQQLEAGIREMDSTQAGDALDDVDRINDELRRRKPDGGRMTQLLERITAVVAPVSGLLEVADHVRELIALIPH